MLDLQKYLKRAEADPGFKAKLLKNANQAIKGEFGEDLPYKLKCKEKLVFEVEPMDGLADSDLVGVAGGGPLTKYVKAFNPSNLKGTVFFPNDSNYGTYYTKDERGNPIKTNIMKSGNKTVEVPNKPRLGAIPDAELSGVAGGGPLTKYVKAFNPSNLKGTVFFPNDSNYGTYYTKDERGNPIKTNIMKSGNKTVEVPNKPRLDAIPDAELSGVAGGELTADWNSTWDTNPKTADEYRRSYGFNNPQNLEGGNEPMPSLDLTRQSGGLIVNTGDGGSKVVPPELSISDRHGWWRY